MELRYRKAGRMSSEQLWLNPYIRPHEVQVLLVKDQKGAILRFLVNFFYSE